jgi:excinuclease ABC subunit C
VRERPGAVVLEVVPRLPRAPGVYRFRDAAGRALYLGRAASLRSRVGSYWGDLGGRAHLARMVAAIARVEAVGCASEHEAAWLERSLLESTLLPWNKTPGGQEVEVYLRLDESARLPGLTVVHDCRPGEGARYFGPYLGGLRVRLAAAALLRVFPLDYAGDTAGTVRELGRQRGARPADRAHLAAAIGAVLQREPAAVVAAQADLTSRREAAAAAQAYELAGRIHSELVSLGWVTAPQRAAVAEPTDAIACGWADGVLTRFEISGGRIRAWRLRRQSEAKAAPLVAATPPYWREFADHNARLAARLRSVSPAGS